ncbi:hypothetical protein C8Q77DRAFT_74265 [Trametes polyzona]|nr:hypothetical protein C8Q77DRAFT_74265 [Trametes polyzona]
MKEHPPPDLGALTPLFLTIHLLGGHIGLPILVATFLFSKTAKRHPTVINFCVIWILYSIIYCLLLYGGRELQEDPSYALCLTQAAMNYGAPPMAVVAGFAVVIQVIPLCICRIGRSLKTNLCTQIWSTFVEPWKEARLANIPRWFKLLAIIVPPYLVFAAFTITAGYYGLRNPHWVRVKNGLYCGLMGGEFEMLAVPIFCGAFVALIIGFEVATIIRYFRGRCLIKKVFPLVGPKQPSLSPWCRAAFFLVYAAMTLGVCIMDLKQNTTAFGYMIQAALPLAAFLIFGLQKDVILTWFFWNRKSGRVPEGPTIAVSGSPGRVNRTRSLMSNTTIDSTTPITTHSCSSLSHPGGSIV